MRRALLCCVLLSAPAFAWESVCEQYPDTSLEASALSNGAACSPSGGPNTARQRWVGPLDEHRQLFEKTRELAGLPASISATQHLRVFTGNTPVIIGSATLSGLTPVDFAQTLRGQTRSFTAGELAQLPDFSYSLWDWVEGHERCPLNGVSADSNECHDFASHMGPVNANHFVPLAQQFYRQYHLLALGRAQACKALKTTLGAEGPRFQRYLDACELEAVTLEAVGQHYLQDAFSMGHMWQRWGSPELSDFPGGTIDEQRERAVLIALASGLLHGARGVLQTLPSWTSYDVNDALCAPNDAVHNVSVDGVGVAIGDDYLGELSAFGGSTKYDAQWTRLSSCAVSGLLEVYRAAGEQHGAATPAAGLVSVDPLSDTCFGQRATNSAMLAAAAVNLKVAGKQATIALNSQTVGWMLPRVATSQGDVPVSTLSKNRFRLGLQRFVSMTRLYATKSPDGTEVANGALGSFLGVSPNGAYVAKTPLSSYGEPPLPWSTSGDTRAQSLSRGFHEAHAADLCGSVDANELSAIVAHTADTTLDSLGKAAACEACAEIISRHLRVGAAGSYDTAREPLCALVSPSAAIVYQAGTSSDSIDALARARCGCP